MATDGTVSGNLDLLPPRFAAWFAAQGWRPHPHHWRCCAAAREGRSALLVAPTGGGKTLAGFPPSLVALTERPQDGLHTLYISPLKALAGDIHRNLERPLAELDLPIRIETRTGDTPALKRQRQREHPPQMLMTTPESLALLLSYPDAGEFFAGLGAVVIDELHALAGTKRGARPGADGGPDRPLRDRRLARCARRLSRRRCRAHNRHRNRRARSLDSVPEEALPWVGHMAMHAVPAIRPRPGYAVAAAVTLSRREPGTGTYALISVSSSISRPLRMRTTSSSGSKSMPTGFLSLAERLVM
jgi:hypothetical protein